MGASGRAIERILWIGEVSWDRSRSMKILQAPGTFLPVKGGCPYFVHYLTQYLEDAGHDCRIVTTGSGDQPEVETVAVDRAWSRDVAGFPVSPTYPAVLRRSISEFNPDIVHTHYPLPLFPEVASLLAAVEDIPLLLTSHGAFEMTWDSAIGAFANIYNKTLLKLSMAAADRIHISNTGIFEEIPLFEDNAEKVRTVPMGVDTDWFDPDAVSGNAPYPDTGADTILFVGAFRRYKGLECLLEAFDQIVKGRDAHLVLVGDGPLNDSLRSIVSEFDIGSSVTFTGQVSDEELRRAYSGADLFVLPSPTISESFGLVTLEAMAMGLPVVVTSGSGIGHVLGGDGPGTVVEPSDPDSLSTAIDQLLSNPERRRTEAAHGRQYVLDRFAWSELVDEYDTLYRETVRHDTSK